MSGGLGQSLGGWSSFALTTLPFPPKNWSLTSSQSNKHGEERRSVDLGVAGASMKMPGQVTLEQ